MPRHKEDKNINRETVTFRIRKDLLRYLRHQKADEKIETLNDFVEQAIEEKIRRGEG